MANVTRDVSVTKSAYIKKAYPSTHYGTNSGTQYLISPETGGWNMPPNRLLFGIGGWPASLKRNRLISAKIRVYVRAEVGTVTARICNDFDAGSVTYDTQPSSVTSGTTTASASDLGVQQGTWNDVWLDLDASQAKKILNATAFTLEGSDYTYGVDPWMGKVVLAGGGTPYVRVTYSNSEIETCTAALVGRLANNTNPTIANSLSWRIYGTNGYACYDDTWTQSSAKFYWRVSGASSWNSINVSGSTTSLSVPANTFPAGKTIEYYVAVTETGGSTVNTSTATFTTATPTLTVTAPSNTDSRTAKTWSWTLKFGSTEYTQSSAKFYWRVSGAETWNQINVSGNTKTLTVPGYTFPAGSTIQWYLTSTDKDSNPISSGIGTFTTLSTTLTVTGAPSGNDYDSRGNTVFTWTLRNSSGDYTQASAKLYWKLSTVSTYTVVNVSGNTKTVTIPGYTFPANSTIQWYLSVTDSTGTVKTTDVASFKTLPFTLVITSAPSGSNVGTLNAISFAWTLANTQGAATQKSAVLYWRVQGAATYNAITNSTSTKSISVPANTFPTASTIQWYISVTASDNTVNSTSAATFTTVSPQITATQYPSGSKVDTRSATVIKWEFRSAAGNYGAKSATFYWRVSGASTYNAINAAANASQLTVPANTFPTGATIQWYLSGVDSSNHSSQTTATTFTTVTPQITPTIYPSGSNVYSGEDITIKWKLASDVGDYSQKSAVFYWRLTTSEEYRTINVSGNTQQVTIPALTFPTNATVYWYITAVDSGNHSSQTSVQNFKTSTTQITPQSSPTSGYTNPRNPITFSWYFAASGGSIPQGSASLYWRVQGESNWTQVAASGSTTSVTIPANTFPVASIIEWYIAGSDSSGTSSQSSVYSFSTTASTVYAVVKSPVNSGVDGSAPITFQWTLTTADGYPASRVILQWKLPTEDDQHWHTLVDTNNAITQYTVDGGTFQPGEINWRVRAYNVDSVEGVGTSASFVCVIAPTITTLSATNVPFSVVSWQAVDQQGYLLEIDGVKFGPYPGTEKQFAVPDYFRDGVHTIRLRILGTVDLWSDWAETTVSIQNVPGDPITLQAESEINVALEWQATDAETDFYIYRDGKLIGRTANTKFVDRYSLGTHEYVVINRLDSGNYSTSEALSETTEVKYMYLSTVDGLTEVEVIYSIKNSSDPVHKNSRESYMNKLSGHSYPAMTKSRFLDHLIDCSAVFLYTEAEKNKQFQKLLGEEIVAKLCDGTCCVAVIESYTRTPKKTYYTAYEFTLHQIEWEDFDDTQ